ncbi:MAG: SAM-dependent chlorinase/fluorinase [Myxococcaceae bacterium]
MPALISFLSDFGRSDTYVGQVKGVIARESPDIRVIDLTHEVPAQDLRTGAFLLMTSVEVFPEGTVHLAVVDPGVGSSRRAIAVETRRSDVLVGPDNGLLAPAIERLGGAVQVVVLDASAEWGPRRSTTFHGRDLFGPVAARIAVGRQISTLGKVVDRLEVRYELPQPISQGTFVRGEVLHIDTYGNLVTNIPEALLPERFVAFVGEAVVTGAPHSHYGEVAAGELLALVGSSGYLEISARDASASLRTLAKRGDPIVLQRE